MRYAVKVAGKVRDQWFVCEKVRAKEYGPQEPDPGALVWSDACTTAYICKVGEELKVVELD